MPEKKIEYRVERIDCRELSMYEYKYELESLLNRHGVNGWELAQIDNFGSNTLLILKRER